MADRNSVFKIRYIFYFTAILLAFLSLASYSQFDSALLAGGVDGVPKNWIGKLGAVFSMCAFYLIGIAAYLLPVFALIRVIRLMLP